MFSGLAAAGVGAVGSLIGGAINAHNARAQMQAQREFAQNGIRWKVADAKAAGIHPLAALGAQTFSYNPIGVGDYGISDAFKSMGQGISRAAEAKQLADERALNARLTEAQIRNVNAQTSAVEAQTAASMAAVANSGRPPAMPLVNGDESQGDRTGLYVDKSIIRDGFILDEHGRKIGIVPSDDMKSRTEDVLGVEWFPFISSAWRDIKGRLFRQKVDGHWWHGDFDNGEYLPYPRTEARGKIDKTPRTMRNFITVEFPNMR